MSRQQRQFSPLGHKQDRDPILHHLLRDHFEFRERVEKNHEVKPVVNPSDEEVLKLLRIGEKLLSLSPANR